MVQAPLASPEPHPASETHPFRPDPRGWGQSQARHEAVGRGQGSACPPLPNASAATGPRDRSTPREAAYARSLVIYEDEEVLALNKPSGLAVQGGTKTNRHVDGLLSAWGEGAARPRLVHRLDPGHPLGCWCWVKVRRPPLSSLAPSLNAGRKRSTGPWCLGFPKPGEGIIDAPLAKKGVGDREMVIPVDPKDPKAETAETEFVTLARAGPMAAWMALRPHTGAHPSASRAFAYPWATRSWATSSTIPTPRWSFLRD